MEDISDPNRPILQPCGLDGFDYQLDPYFGCGHQCQYCYALCGAGGSWVSEVRGYEHLAERLRAEVARLEPQTIYMGLYSDPYQPAERGRGDTGTAVRVLEKAGFSAHILTKSDLFLRDLEFLASMPGASISISLAFSDPALKQALEPKTPSYPRRLRALKEAKAAGLKTSALICPVLPFLTDLRALVEMVEGVAERVWIYPLSMRNESDPNWRQVWQVIQERRPKLSADFKEAVFDREHAHWREQRELAGELAEKSSAKFIIRL